MAYRIGHGIDTHATQQEGNKPLILGGVHFACEPGLKAHSDGDLVLHAICDSILGALGEDADIGTLFPDTDSKNKNLNSGLILKKVLKLLKYRKWHIVNLDINIISELIKISPYRLDMKNSLAKMLSIKNNHLSIKAKTAEKMGALGRGEGIAVNATILLKKNKKASKSKNKKK